MTSLVLLTALITSGQAPIPEPINFLKVDAGFKIQRFTNDAQTPDVYCISFGPKGQLLVSGKNYLRIVQDSNQDGVPDHFEDIPIRWSDAPTGHCWDENKIWFTGNQGLWVVQLNDDYKITSSRKVLEFKTGGEHEAHAVRKGPDGNIYVLCGNNTGIQAKHATHPHSPIKNPVAGTLLRYHPKIEKCEILVDGLRNPYGFDFNLEGEIFTYDSDNERCISLPWYEGTRLYHLIPFGRYGWWNPQRADTWRSPPWHADIQKPISNLGRGSPTGVACCLSTKFSSSMVGSMFIADWTFGKIWHCPLQRNGSSYLSKPSAFIEPKGESGFAPTSIAFHPTTGEMFVSMGGRGTQGSIFRIAPIQVVSTEINPLTLSLKPISDAPSAIKYFNGSDLLLKRRALEFFAANPEAGKPFAASMLQDFLASDDIGIRHAAIAWAKNSDEFVLPKGSLTTRVANSLGMATVEKHPAREGTLAMNRLAGLTADPQEQLVAIRIVQMAMGNLPYEKDKAAAFDGYRVQGNIWRPSDQQWGMLANIYSSQQLELNTEIERTFAIGQPSHQEILAKLLASLLSEKDPVRQIHLLLVLARQGLPFQPKDLNLVAATLVDLESKLTSTGLKRDRNWPLRIQELHQSLASQNPNFNQALLSQKQFGLSGHTVFLKHLGTLEKQAASLFADAIIKSPDQPWSNSAIQALRLLDSTKAKPALRVLWGEHGLDEAIALLLLKDLQPEDLPKIYQVFPTIGPEQLTTILNSLKKVPSIPEDKIILLAKRFPILGKEPDQLSAKKAILEFLHHRYPDSPAEPNIEPWLVWTAKNQPTLNRALQETSGVNYADWQVRAASLKWENGNPTNGQKVFQQRKCSTCHGGSAALGPSLEGISKRFSRDDLLQAIILPDKDVPNRYRATVYTTHMGKVITGLVIYDSAAGAMIQLGTGETVRLNGDEIASRKPTSKSLMPTGLLDGASDQEMIDLFAYLQQPAR